MEKIFASATVPIDDYTTTIKTPRHEIMADEPADEGGRDTAPTPKEMMMGSLSACTVITLKMYAARKQWDVTGVDVRCELFESEDKKVAPRIERVVTFPGGLDQEQRERLLKVANACPVHKMLEASLEVETRAG